MQQAWIEKQVPLPELSEKGLTERLKDLMAIGLVTQRKASGKGAASVYALTPKGFSLSTLLHLLYEWGEEHADAFDVELGDPLAVLHERERLSARAHRAIR